MLSWSTARQRIWEIVEPLRHPSEEIAAREGIWRVLRENVVAPMARPNAECSAMDGFAVRAGDLRGATPDSPVRLPVVAELYAGHAGPAKLDAGQTMAIATGAVVPAGADAVVRKERATREGAMICFYHPVPEGKDLRRRGEEIARGDIVLRAGVRIDAEAVSRICGIGVEKIEVCARPRVVLMSSGDELSLEGPDRLPDANLPFLRAFCQQRGLKAQSESLVGDCLLDIRSHLHSISPNCDLLITTGGLSAGDKDYMIPVADEMGAEWLFRRVAMRPGKPVSLAKVGSFWWLMLPGNPGAVAATVHSFLPLLLDRLEGRQSTAPELLIPWLPVDPPQNGSHSPSAWTRVLSARIRLHGPRIRAQLSWGRPSSYLPEPGQSDLGWAAQRSPETASQAGSEVAPEAATDAAFAGSPRVWVALPPSQDDEIPLALPLSGELATIKRTKVPCVAFVGTSGSGKTKVLCDLIAKLQGDIELWVAKSTHHQEAFESPHKDSARLFAAGASQVFFVSPSQEPAASSALEQAPAGRPGHQLQWKRGSRPWTPQELQALAADCDQPPQLLLLEGFSTRADAGVAVLGPGQRPSDLQEVIAQRKALAGLPCGEGSRSRPKILAYVHRDPEAPCAELPCFHCDDISSLAKWLLRQLPHLAN